MREIAAGLLFLLLALPSFAQTVTQRVRVGHSVEDMDVMGNQIVVLDGYEVFAADKNGFRKILDARDAGVTSHVNSFTWIDSEKLFAFIEPLNRGFMILADATGRPMGTRAITRIGGFFPTGSEGLTWLPKGTPFPDHLALVAVDDAGRTRIEIMTTDGNVVHEIFLDPAFDDLLIGSVDVLDDDHLVVALLPNLLCVVDYTGAIVSGPVRVYEAANVEAVVRTHGGIAFADYYSGRVFALDRNLQRRPQDDLHNDIGVKIHPIGLTWNPDTFRYIVMSDAAANDTVTSVGFSLPVSLDDPVPIFHPSAHNFIRSTHPTYLPDEHKIAIANRRLPAAILVYAPNGRLLEQIDVSTLVPGAQLNNVVYVPSTHELYLRFNELTPRFRVVSRTGAFLRDVDLSGTGTSGFGAMTVAGDDLLVRTNAGLLRLDLNGAVLATYDMAPLRVPRLSGLASIMNGPYAGKFAACDSTGAEIVVFTLP